MSQTVAKTFTVTDDATGASFKLPVYRGTLGPDVADVRKFFADSGAFTFDPGYASTGSCESKLTYIDGDQGILLHGGYSIEDLASKSTFLEVCYLLLNGELPNAAQREDFVDRVTRHTMIHDQLFQLFRGFRRDAHPMAVMTGVVGALSAFYHDHLDVNSPEDRMISAIRLIAKTPTIAAMAYKFSVGQPFVYPRNNLSYAGNFLSMTFSVPAEDYVVNPVLERAMDKIFILHADHEQNASTSTVRIAGSSQANPFACIAAGIASLWGPAHGGANEAVLIMLNQIGDPSRVGEFVKRAKDPNDPFRLMGFGHRVYKNFDPRAKILKTACDEVLADLGINDPRLEIALQLEKIALEDEYFVKRKLYPNVDFYSGIILSAMGFPTSMFTVLFALARTVGWISQWKEMMEDPARRINRPRQLYVGPAPRAFVELDSR